MESQKPFLSTIQTHGRHKDLAMCISQCALQCMPAHPGLKLLGCSSYPRCQKQKEFCQELTSCECNFLKMGNLRGKYFSHLVSGTGKMGSPWSSYADWLIAGLSHPTVSAGNCEVMIAFQGLNFTLLPLHILNYLPEKRRWEGLRELSSLQQRPQESLQPLTLLSMSEMKL